MKYKVGDEVEFVYGNFKGIGKIVETETGWLKDATLIELPNKYKGQGHKGEGNSKKKYETDDYWFIYEKNIIRKVERKLKKIIDGKDLVNMQFIETEDGLLKRYEKKGKFVPEIGKAYWFVNENGNIKKYSNNNDRTDKWVLKHNLVFETEEECEEYKNYLVALDKYSYDFSSEEWENMEIYKYYLYFDYCDKSINISEYTFVKRCISYFKSDDDAQAFINEVGDEAIERFMFGYYR